MRPWRRPRTPWPEFDNALSAGGRYSILELLEPAQDFRELRRCGQPLSQAALKRAEICHNDVAGSLIAPLRGLVDDFIGVPLKNTSRETTDGT